MGIVSYAQNFEDVMLWRALGHVERGCYIDIGAQHPVVDSVSKAFYEHGWRGTHVEPTASYADLLRKDRPDELVVQAAIAEEEGHLGFFEIADTGLSTASPEIADRHRLNGYGVRETVVAALTMDALLGLVEAPDIHWLKIDVEGFEKQVLSGWRKSSRRPWIVVLESTAPISQTETHEGWEFLVLEKDYELAYVDGLNRYYVSTAHLDLKDEFRFGPCIFDDFELSEFAWSTKSIKRHHEERLAEMSRERGEIQRRLDESHESYKLLEAGVAERERACAERLVQLNEACSKLRQDRLDGDMRIAELDGKISAAHDLEAVLRADLSRQSKKAALTAAQLAHMKRTLSWRMTSPLRSLGYLLFGNVRYDDKRFIGVDIAENPATDDQFPLLSTRQNFAAPAVEPDSLMSLSETTFPEYHSIHQPPTMFPIQHVDQLLELRGSAFLSGVYQALLGRSPDEEGERFYLGRLRAGYSKASVIAQISRSVEAQPLKAGLAGLADLVAEQRRASHWFFGLFCGDGRIERKMNQLEYQLGCVADQLEKLEAAPRATSIKSLNLLGQESGVDSSTLTPRARQILAGFSQAQARSMETKGI